MILARYGHPGNEELLAKIDDRYPFPFLEAYHAYLQDCRKGEPFLAFSEDGEVCLSLRLFRVRSFRFVELMFPPVREGEQVNADEEADFLCDLVSQFAASRFCDRIVQPPPHCLFRSAPNGSVACHFGSYVLTLGGRSDKEIFFGMHGDHRREIRLAAKARLCVEFGSRQLQDFFALYSATMSRSGMYCAGFEEIGRLHDRLSASENVVCGVVYQDGAPLSGLLVPFTKQGAYYLYGGTAEAVTVAGANKLLHWETIRMLLRRGVARYNFVGARLSDVSGSKLEHIQRFKARFGGTLETGYLWKMDVVKRRVQLYDFLVAMRKRLRLRRFVTRGDIIDQERAKQVGAHVHVLAEQ